ncbi:hypothetical protein QP64_00030, partial [Staphylococcus aureus]
VHGERHQQAGAPEKGTVLADVPALIDRPTSLAGTLDLPVENAVGPVMVRIEEVAPGADHVVGTMSDDALGPAVPAREDPVPVEGDDREIFGALDDLAIARLACTDLGLGSDPLLDQPGRADDKVDDLE